MCGKEEPYGGRIKYMPMGYFGDHNLENLISVVTTTMGDIENNASTVLTNILGGPFPRKDKESRKYFSAPAKYYDDDSVSA